MFSSTTIASSITMPTASASASSVIMLSVKPCNHISAKVPMIEIGIASAAMSVLRTLPRNSSTTSAASSAPTHQVLLHRVDAGADGRGVVADDLQLRRRRQRALRPPRGACSTVSTTATVFVPDCLRIESTTVCSPS